MIVPVILAGGTGSRLWPLSRSAYPKQLLPLVTGNTMLQETVLRTREIKNSATPLVICNQEHRFLAAEQLHQVQMSEAQIILEPFGRNTAPAATIAALFLQKEFNDPLLLILPADHIIKDANRFAEAIAIGEQYAEKGQLVTFGVLPAQPETGYGYIKAGKKMPDKHAFHVEQFVEKPDAATANAYVASGLYFWNSGMFMFRASAFLAELQKYEPSMLRICESVVNDMTIDLDFIRINPTNFTNCSNNSIDYAVMEKTKNATLVPLNTVWSDVGSWSALWEVHETDNQGNVIQGDVITEQVTNSYLRAENRMLAVVGVTDHIVIETADAVLVAHKDNSQAVKKMVDVLKQKERPETDLHRRVYRPWGYYETLDSGQGFQVKRILVKEGASLSLQMHLHRSEHWVVVKGVATVTCGEKIYTLKQNESTYIPVGVKHRLANLNNEPLEIIEVQSGSYLSEDDIIRFDDIYGRIAETA